MDEQLAAIYGTGQMDEEDLVKTASAELLVKLAEEEGVDLDEFSDEEIAEMITNLEGGGEVEEDGSEKVAEADYLGRVMAHSMVQELGEIEKEAGRVSDAAGKVWGAVKGGAGWAKEKAVRGGKAVGGYHARGAKQMASAFSRKSKEGIGERAKRFGIGASKFAPHAAVGAGGIYAATRGKKKKASALSKLAEDRAYQILAENGWVDDEGNVFAPQNGQTKVASQLDYAVEAEALQMLEEAGYPVQWNE